MNRQSFGASERASPLSEPTSPWWDPRAYADRRPFLHARARICGRVRSWFAEQDFIEVEPCCLQVSPGAEAHLSAFSTDLVGPDGASRRLYLHASPEFACKKLLAAGESAIFYLGRVFRNRDMGPLHLPEFTMIEWYRARRPLARIEADCLDLLRLAAETAGAKTLRWRAVEADPFADHERLTVAEAFHRVGIDLMGAMDPAGVGDRAALASQAAAIGMRTAVDDSWSDLFSKILSDRIEPSLGVGRPTILYDYPSCESALARPRPRDPRVAERFELYCCGVELANAFGELSDPAEQRRRLLREREVQTALYGEAFPLDEEFISALALMPDASGCAMGFDRLAMLAAGAQRIEQVAWTPMTDPARP